MENTEASDLSDSPDFSHSCILDRLSQLINNLQYKSTDVVVTHQSVVLSSAVSRHRNRHRPREVLPRWCTAGSFGHRELGAGQAEVQGISWDTCRDGWRAACCMHPLESWKRVKQAWMLDRMGHTCHFPRDSVGTATTTEETAATFPWLFCLPG